MEERLKHSQKTMELEFPVCDEHKPMEINQKAFRLVECEPLIDIEGLEVKAAAECAIGGYYLSEPTTKL